MEHEHMMIRSLASTTWRVALWGAGLGAAFGAIYGTGIMLVSASPDGVPVGLAYGCYLGLFAGTGLGLLNGMALGCAFRVDESPVIDERAWARRYAAMGFGFNAILLLIGVVVARLSLPGFSLGADWATSVINALVIGTPIVLAVGSATWVDTHLARWYVRTSYYNRRAR